MDSVRVGIIGIDGLYGRWFERVFHELGCSVDGSDPKFDVDILKRNKEVVANADVVIFSVPPRVMPDVIRDVISESRPDQLWIDCGCLKVEPVRAMLESRAEVVGIHPMCAPTKRLWEGQTVIVCPARLRQWKTWFDAFIQETEARAKVSTPEEHDKNMAIVEGLIHANVLITAGLLERLNINVPVVMEYMSPIYRLFFSFLGRILRQDPDLYADIQMLNPSTKKMLDGLEQEVKAFRKSVDDGDVDGFAKSFRAGASHFGRENLFSAYYLYDEMSQILTDRLGEHQIILVIEDKPGTLHRLSRYFSDEGINLTSLHTFRSVNGFCMRLGIDHKRSDPKTQRAIKAIIADGLATIAP
ncbi:MAG: prephenate dehydrogenase/arogenate dehydrogenase family protein [Patescibacteria group bacterium]|jgi:prephenate dehydrogenase